ncbi:MAG: TIGR02301 family protein [Alphaproteobacteria bacterium]|jgi:uncharacterized protein (TIGR02301 family)
MNIVQYSANRRPLSHGVIAVLIAAGLAVSGQEIAQAQFNTFSQPNTDDRPYDSTLLRLSEIMGAVHYLRELCGAHEGQIWRDQMRDLIESEGTTAIRRARLVKGFNKGYRGYRRTYRSCTEPARIAIDRFMEEGATLAELLIKENQPPGTAIPKKPEVNR